MKDKINKNDIKSKPANKENYSSIKKKNKNTISTKSKKDSEINTNKDNNFEYKNFGSYKDIDNERHPEEQIVPLI